MNDYVIYTDGGSRGNPGESGAGAVVVAADGTVLAEAQKYTGMATNNFAEYEAVILGLETLKRLVPEKKRKDVSVLVKLDSELIQKQLTNQYQVKMESLFPQFIRVHNILVKDFPNVSFTHIPRAQNEHADRLANQAMDEKA